MLLVGDITFPHWDGDPQFEPYTTYKQLDDALNRGQSLDAAERTADWEQLLIDNSDEYTGKLLLKAVDKRRADVVRFMVERGADLNHLSQLTVGAVHAYPQESSVLHTAVRYGRYSDAAFVLDLGDAVNVDVPLQGDNTRNRTPLMRAVDRACVLRGGPRVDRVVWNPRAGRRGGTPGQV